MVALRLAFLDSFPVWPSPPRLSPESLARMGTIHLVSSNFGSIYASISKTMTLFHRIPHPDPCGTDQAESGLQGHDRR